MSWRELMKVNIPTQYSHNPQKDHSRGSSEDIEDIEHRNENLKPPTACNIKNHSSKKFSQHSQPRLGINLKTTCIDCKHKESIPGVGSGCVYKTKGDFPDIWSLLVTLDGCPRGYWN